MNSHPTLVGITLAIIVGSVISMLLFLIIEVLA